MKCAALLAGGIGDYLLGNRFVPGIINSFNLNKVDLISVSEHHGAAERNGKFIIDSFPYLYNDLFTINVNAGNPTDMYSIKNMSKDDADRLLSYDAVFELTIDSLLWMKYGHRPIRNFYHFPKPVFQDSLFINKPYILLHFFQRSNVGSYVSVPVENAIKITNLLSEKYTVIHPIYSGNEDIVKTNLKDTKCEFVSCSLEETWSLARHCLTCVGVSSSIRLFPNHFGIPSFTLFGNGQPFTDNPAYSIRWGIFPKFTFPLDIEPVAFSKLVLSVIERQELELFPDYFNNDVDSLILNKKAEENNPLYSKFLKILI
jgi:hypothetical protein